MGYERRRSQGLCKPLLGADDDRGRDFHQLQSTTILRLPAPFALHYGDALPNPRVAFRLVGPADAPVIAVLGGISAHRGRRRHGRRGLVARDRRTRPRRRYAPLTGCSASTISAAAARVPRRTAAASFRPSSSYDQADVLCAVVRHLGLEPLHAIVGASYGGMVALCFAERYARRWSNHIVVVERRRQVPGAVDRLAQRAAADRARGHRARRRRRRA